MTRRGGCRGEEREEGLRCGSDAGKRDAGRRDAGRKSAETLSQC